MMPELSFVQENVRRVVDEFRPGFQADGADIEIVEVSPESVRLQLITGPDTCEDCLLPREALESLFQTALRKTLGEMKVVLEDSRGSEA